MAWCKKHEVPIEKVRWLFNVAFFANSFANPGFRQDARDKIQMGHRIRRQQVGLLSLLPSLPPSLYHAFPRSITSITNAEIVDAEFRYFCPVCRKIIDESEPWVDFHTLEQLPIRPSINAPPPR